MLTPAAPVVDIKSFGRDIYCDEDGAVRYATVNKVV